LVNPRAPMPTGPIFRAFDRDNPSPPSPLRRRPTRFAGFDDLSRFLAASRNDLEPYAVRRRSSVGVARKFLADCPGAMISRMSGSGATVFALHASKESAVRAARGAGAKGWWSLASKLSA